MTPYISELNIWSSNGGDFVEIAASSGTDMTGYTVYVYANDGTISGGPFGLGSAVNTISGTDVFVVDAAGSGISISGTSSIALVDDTGTVLQFIVTRGNSTTATEGPANGLTSLDLGNVDANESVQSDDGGLTYYAQPGETKGTIPCFGPGTLIETSNGLIPVELLSVGDLVVTLEGQLEPIVWTQSVSKTYDASTTTKAPILISKGALGPNTPSQDLVVSSQHRILMGIDGQLTHARPQNTLIPAKTLTSLPGVRHMLGKRHVTWHHFALSKHAVISANQCASETLLLGPMVLNKLDKFQRYALKEKFPKGRLGCHLWNGPPARACLPVSQAHQSISELKHPLLPA